jgi:hypothetical protein
MAHKAKPDPWSTRLARPIDVIGGPTLRTLAEARAFMVAMPQGDQLRTAWQRAAELILAAANGGSVAAVTRQVELALFMQARWLGK